jgi:hypothetical protein
MTTAVALVKPPQGTTLVDATSDCTAALGVGTPFPGRAPGWLTVPLHPSADGRARLTLRYSDGTTQVINYRTIEPFDLRVDRYGRFQVRDAV